MHLSQFAVRLNADNCAVGSDQFALRVTQSAPSPANAISGESATTATVPTGANNAIVQNTTTSPITYTRTGFPPLQLLAGERMVIPTEELKLYTFGANVTIWYLP
jgi:hypothetical protein